MMTKKLAILALVCQASAFTVVTQPRGSFCVSYLLLVEIQVSEGFLILLLFIVIFRSSTLCRSIQLVPRRSLVCCKRASLCRSIWMVSQITLELHRYDQWMFMSQVITLTETHFKIRFIDIIGSDRRLRGGRSGRYRWTGWNFWKLIDEEGCAGGNSFCRQAETCGCVHSIRSHFASGLCRMDGREEWVGRRAL
jgi:hypothetical protein